MRVTILGSGSSGGVPTLGLGWGACDPLNPRNRRLRPSILVEEGRTVVLVDTSPDLRQQLLGAAVTRLDGVLFTHGHADHLHGIDDLRGINRSMNRPIECYADEETLATIRERFGYVLEPLKDGFEFYYKPTLDIRRIGPGDRFRVGEIPVLVFDQDHGYSRTLGFRFGPVAYSTDLCDLTEESFAALRGVEVWIVGTLTDRPHPTHVHVDKALGWIRRVRPRRAVLHHLGPDLDYDALSRRLPAGVEVAYDGCVVTVEMREDEKDSSISTTI